jgi:hypothetical protein
VEEPLPRATPGPEPETGRDGNDRDGQNPTAVSGNSSRTQSGAALTPTTLLLQQRNPEGRDQAATTLESSVTQLLQALNDAELSGALTTEIEIRQRQFD